VLVIPFEDPEAQAELKFEDSLKSVDSFSIEIFPKPRKIG
jgi:hypothetical protein